MVEYVYVTLTTHRQTSCAAGSITAERATKYAGEQEKGNSCCVLKSKLIREENLT